MEVAKIARDFGAYLGLDTNKIVKSALTHDIGKLKIRKDLLHKPGYFNQDERNEMGTHSIKSSELLDTLTGDHKRLAKIGAEFHHTNPQELERLKNEGTLSEVDITIIKVITIADVFEALISHARPYKKGLSHLEALSTLEKINHIDKELLERFKKWQLSHFTQLYRS
jgi:HD-GYP domain-containing protein (c-di-GMP phosphodiesterase class II)